MRLYVHDVAIVEDGRNVLHTLGHMVKVGYSQPIVPVKTCGKDGKKPVAGKPIV